MNEAEEISSQDLPIPTETSSRLSRIAFVVSQFPETHETFILREFTALREMGLDFVILSLKRCRDRVIQKEALCLLDRTYYLADCTQGAPRLAALKSVVSTAGSLPWLRAPASCAYLSHAARKFSGLARTLGVEHIHAHWATAPTSTAVIMSNILDVPYSFTAHAWDIYAGDQKLAPKAGAAKFVTTCTAANVLEITERLDESLRDKVLLNYHGVPHRSFAAPETAPPDAAEAGAFLKVIAAGRLVETKGFQYLIDAVGKTRCPVSLTLIGDGPLAGRLKKQAARVGLNSKITFTGMVSNADVLAALRKHDCLVMPSVVAKSGDRDGIPNVVLEAMAAGLPVVASAISGIPEAVVDGENGLLLEPRDTDAIARALEWMDANRGKARKMGTAGRCMAEERFDAEKNASLLLGIFERFIGRPKS